MRPQPLAPFSYLVKNKTMTAAQKQNQIRFKKVVREAAKLRAKNKKLTQGDAVKKAWALLYPKKPKIVSVNKKEKVKKAFEKHKDNKSHNVNIRIISGIELSEDQKKFLQIEGKKSKGYKYRSKILWGDFIVLKETISGTPLKKWIVDNMEVAEFLADQLNKGQYLSKIKTVKKITGK